ncbi:MAG TPA: ArsR family transcriptional regulator [Acidimicrobiia bacterium]|nr:ArsR family transcriptional regulator [Acidimicrobiia bacterium]
MKTKPPPLLPLLRSAHQAEILTRLLLGPQESISLTDLARVSGASLATVQREVERAEASGVVQSERVGPTRLVRANPSSPLYRPLADLLLVAFGPVPVVTDELAGIPGIEDAYLFGSWAARYSGEAGAAPNDVDVLVIGEADRDAVYDAADRAERRLHRPVQITFRSADEWADSQEPFIATVRSRPLVRLELGDDR